MPKSKEVISDTGSESGSGSSEEEKVKSKPKKQEKKVESSASENSDSEEESKTKKRPKKGKDERESNKKLKKENKSSDGEPIWDLGNKKQVTVRHFKGKLYVDIREMYLNNDGEMKPGKKGVCLNLDNWRELVKVVDEVDKCVKSKK